MCNSDDLDVVRISAAIMIGVFIGLAIPATWIV